MLEVADRVLSDFELKQHQALIVAHGDTYYEHFHLMINRVSWVTTEAKKTPFDYHRLEKALRHLERELGLKETPGRHFRLDGQAYAGRKTGVRLGNEERQHAREALRQAQSWRSLEDQLARKGLILFVERKALHITDGARTERAGALVRGGSLAKLEERFGQPFAEYRIQADISDHTEGHLGKSEGALPSGHAAADAMAIAVEEFHETDPYAMAEQYENGSHLEPRVGEGRGPAEQTDNAYSQAPSLSGASGERTGDAAREVLDDLHTHSEVVRLSTRRSNLIRQANALEANLIGLQEQVEELRAQHAQLDRYFRDIYREAERARASFDADAVLVGPPEAAERLRSAPEAFGELRGR